MWWSTVGCLVTLTLSLLAAPRTAAAQPMAPVPRIGILRTVSPPPAEQEAFRQGLQDLGYVVGQNVTIADRFVAGSTEGLPALAAELVRLPVAVLFTMIYFFDPSGNRLETFGGYTAYQMDPDTHAITWTADRMTQGVSYYATELNESFLKVYT